MVAHEPMLAAAQRPRQASSKRAGKGKAAATPYDVNAEWPIDTVVGARTVGGDVRALGEVVDHAAARHVDRLPRDTGR